MNRRSAIALAFIFTATALPVYGNNRQPPYLKILLECENGTSKYRILPRNFVNFFLRENGIEIRWRSDSPKWWTETLSEYAGKDITIIEEKTNKTFSGYKLKEVYRSNNIIVLSGEKEFSLNKELAKN